jgi:hypothetical protein
MPSKSFPMVMVTTSDSLESTQDGGNSGDTMEHS